MHTRPPNYIADHLLPVQMTAERRLEIVLQNYVRSVMLFAENPRNFSTIPMSELGICLLVTEAVRGCLKNSSDEEIFHFHEAARINVFENSFSRNKW